MTTLKSPLKKIIQYLKPNQKDTSNTQSSTKEIPNSNSYSEITTNEQIPNTPFRVVGNKERGYFIALGMSRLTNYEKTKNQAINLLNTHSWEITLNIITTVIETARQLDKEQK